NVLAAVARDQRSQNVERQDMALVPRRLFEILEIQRRADGIDVAAQNAAREIHAKEDAPSGGGRDGMVHGVVGVGRDDVAGAGSVQRVGAGDATEIDVLEVAGGGIGAGDNVAAIEAIRDSEAGEAAAQGIAGAQRESAAVLGIVQQIIAAQLVVQRNKI